MEMQTAAAWFDLLLSEVPVEKCSGQQGHDD